MVKVLELFAGIGACSKALERLRIEHKIVDAVEIDKYAIKSFNAIHGTNFEVQDITKWDKDIEVDLIMHGSPCQDFSLAGKQAGGDKGSGTRSSLMYETIRIVKKLKPKYVIWENVKNILSKKHKHNFKAYLEAMENLGYKNYYEVLNAKDYGIPQNRERVFTVSILGSEGYKFPPKQELKLRLKDMLEDEVDEKYYLSDKMINFFYKNEQIQKQKGNGFRFGVSDGNVIAKAVTTRAGARMDDNFIRCIQIGNLDIKGHDSIKRIYSQEGLSPTLTDMQGGNRQPKILIKNATKKGYLEAEVGDGIDISSRMEYHRGTVQKQSIQTITTSGGNDRGVIESNFRIRKLTPKECWRLMGFDDEDIDKCIEIGISNTQLYKQAGNSICVNVLEKILENLL